MLAGTRPGGRGPAHRPQHAFRRGGGRGERHHDRRGIEVPRGPRVPHVRQLLGMFTANSMNCLCEALGVALPGNGTRARRVFRAHPPCQARGHEGDGASGEGRAHPRHRERGRHPQRHGVRHGLRRLHEHGAAPHGHRARGGLPHHDGRLGRRLRPHAASREAGAFRPAPHNRPVPGRAACPRSCTNWPSWGCSTAARSPAWGRSTTTCANAPPRPDGEVVRAHGNPFSPVGALRVLHGNLAPRTAPS